jgi:hypothetical protein
MLHFMRISFLFPFVFSLIMLTGLSTLAQQRRTVGVVTMYSDTAPGYTLFAPLMGTDTYLVDNFGRQINVWKSDKLSGASDYLLKDGSLLRCESLQNMVFNGGGSGGRIKRTSWDGKVMWTYDYSSNNYCQQHDIEYLPNGNVLILAWELKSEAEAQAAGRTTRGNVWMDHVVEVKPSGSNGGQIVWEWHVWDHLIQDKDQSKKNYGKVADHPELIDINFVNNDMTIGGGSSADWLHTNAVFYNEELDQILISVLDFSEVWIIDHSTTKEEAASHSGGKHGKGGDLLYRFGNPAAYKSGTNADRLLYLQHGPVWIPKGYKGEGNIIVFNNGNQSRGSSVDEYKLPVDSEGKYDMKKKPEKVWSYAPSNFYASNMGSAQRLENGNTLICQGPSGTILEVNERKEIVWKYISPVTNNSIVRQGQSVGGGFGMALNQCFRAWRYSPDYEAFEGKNLKIPAAPLEGGELIKVELRETNTLLSSGKHIPAEFSLSSHAIPSNSASMVGINVKIPSNTNAKVKIYNAEGKEITTVVNQYLSAGDYNYKWNANGFARGVYFVKLVTNNYTVADKLVLLK